MARDFIPITVSQTASQAALLLKFKELLRNCEELLVLRHNDQIRACWYVGNRCKAVMDHLHDGIDYTDLERLFGLPAGRGKEAYDLVSASVVSLDAIIRLNSSADLVKRVADQVG